MRLMEDETGRAAVWEEPSFDAISIKEYPVPDVEPDSVLARVVGCGICGTDVHITRGRLPSPFPIILGHEWAGQVEELGDDVETDTLGKPLEEGDYISSATGECGECFYCKETPARPNLCDDLFLFGIMPETCDEPPHFIGAYAEYAYIDGRLPVFKLPDDFTEEECVMAEPIDVAAHVWSKAVAGGTDVNYAAEGADESKSLVVQGVGPIGMSIVTTALVNGVYNIIAVDRIEERLEKAEKLGVPHAINLEEFDSFENCAEYVRDLTHGGVGADLGVEATGEPEAFEQIFDYLRRGATLVEMGHYADAGDAEVNPSLDFCNKEINLFGSWAHHRHDFKRAISIMERAKKLNIPFGDIVSDEIGLDEIVEGLKRHEEHESPGKIVVNPRR